MTERQLAESGCHGRVDGTGVVEENTDGLTDEGGIVARDRARGVGGSELYFLAIDDRGEGAGAMGGFTCAGDAEAFECRFNVAWHDETKDASGLVLANDHADVLGALGAHF